ncbi:MAG: T9SS type A sorting domain-containing protein [Candidatus Marinimicrobia bacterium]|nr:T9SS type A sorting domain-containing protein [Candidatus Neomarinimicrobiota bacterium]
MRQYFRLILFLIIMIAEAFSMGATSVWIEPVGGAPETKYYVGQKVNLQIRIDTYGEKLTGAAIFMTLDTRYLRVVEREPGKPFRRGNFFPRNPTYNNYDEEDTQDNPDANGIEGLQLNYYQETDPAVAGTRPYKQGSGILAYFEVLIVGIPENIENQYVIDYDDDFIHVRQTGYYLNGLPGQRQNFNHKVPFVMAIFGGAIDPAFPDTVVSPGTTFSYYMGNHFYAEEFDKSDAVWSFEILQAVDGVTVELDTVANRDMIHVTASNTSKGLLKLLIRLGIEGSSFGTSQIWDIGIGYSPEFVDPLPVISLLEDIEYLIAVSDIVNDNDDSVEDLFFRYEDDSLVTVTREGELFKLLGKENWYGETFFTLFVTDSMSAEISEKIPLTIYSVNDAPVVDFSPEPRIKNDTLILHHYDTLTFYLPPLVSDVDDTVFSWMTSSEEKLNITISQDTLTLSVNQAGTTFYGNLPLTLTAYDDEILSGSRVLNVLVSSYVPEIDDFGPLLMHADSIKIIDLDAYVRDNDTPIQNLTFDFSVVDSTTRIADNNVFTNFEPASRELTISATSGHNSTDYLIVRAEDVEGNVTQRHIILIVVDSYAPKFLKIPPVIVYQDSFEVLELNRYVFDVRDPSEVLDLEVTGNDIFKSITLDQSTHHLTFTSFSNIFGVDTLKLVAENTYGLTDSTLIFAYCVPRDNKPVLFDVADLELYWNGHYEWLDLDDIVFDVFTPDSELVWDISYNTGLLTLTMNSANFVNILTNSQTGTGQIEMKVTNNRGYTAEQTVNVTVSKDTPPVWDSFQDIYLVKTQPVRKMEWSLFDKCYDAETPTEQIIYTANYESGIIDVDIDALTGEVVFTVLDTSKSGTTMKFIAEDLNGNITQSQLIDVVIGDGLPPVWRNIPTIYMKNSEVFEDLRLLDYCQDTDDLESDLLFSALPSNSNINVEILEDSYVRVTPENGIFGENFYIIFKVLDSQDNLVATSVKLIITDDMPARGLVNYIVNPVLSKRVDFVVATEPSVRDVDANFIKIPATVIPLTFSEMNSNDNGKLWAEEYYFGSEGSYRLIIEMEDINNFVSYDTLTMTIDFPDPQGAQMAMSPTIGTLVLDYPEHDYTSKMIFIEEKNMPAIDNQGSKCISRNEIYYKKYKIKSGIREGDVLLTLRYRPLESLSGYHSFYKISGDEIETLETWKTETGEFLAFVSEDCEVCFGASTHPARKEIIAENHLLCYPNPFNPVVNIKFLVKAPKLIELSVYNILGQIVFREKQLLDAGVHEMSWNGLSQTGVQMPSGVYFIQISQNNKPMKLEKVTLFK